MSNLILKISLISVLVTALSCKKEGKTASSSEKKLSAADTTGILGQWTWVKSNFLFQYETPASGVQKKLTFTSAGIVYITHNDSSGLFPGAYVGVPPVAPPVLLSRAITDTLSYRFGAEPVGYPDLEDINASFMALVIGDDINQYQISNDTLYLVAPPCLAQPDSVIYVRTSGVL